MPRIITPLFLSVVVTLIAIPVSNANHDSNDFFVSDSQLNISALILNGPSANIWGVADQSIAEEPPQIAYNRVSAGVWQSLPTGLTVDGSQDVYVAGVNDVYFVSGFDSPSTTDVGNDLSHYAGTFTLTNIPSLDRAMSVWAFSSSNVWVFGSTTSGSEDSAVAHFNGVTWAVTTIDTDAFVTGDLFAFSSTDIYLTVEKLSPHGIDVYHYNGSTWTKVNSSLIPTFMGSEAGEQLWGTSGTNLYLTGAGNQAGVYRSTNGGVTFTRILAITAWSINGLGSTVWVTSNVGVVWHATDGVTFTNFQPEAPDTARFYKGILMPSATEVYLASVRVSTQAAGVFKLQINPSQAIASLVGFTFDPTELTVTVSQAQCNLDHQSLTVNVGVTQTLNSLNVYIYRATDHVVILTIPSGSMFQDPTGLGGQGVYGVDFQLPTGTYVALARSDFGGLGALDFFYGAAFNVPRGTCVDTADQEILPFIANHFIQTDTYINSTEEANHFEHTQTNSYINSTTANLKTWITYRSSQTNSYVNLTRSDIANLSAQISNINATITGNVSINLTEVENVLLESMNPIADSLDVIFWVLLVAVSYLCANSNRLPIVLAAIPLGLFTLLYGIMIFDSQIFDIAAIATGVFIGTTIFNWRERQDIDEKRKGKNVD